MNESSDFLFIFLNLILIICVCVFLVMELLLLGLMDNNNWRATQGGESSADGGGEWRSRLPHDSRQRIVNKMYVSCKSLHKCL